MRSGITPADLYRTCRVSAWRLETLQHYDVPADEERQQAFHADGVLPPPRAAKLDDLVLITQLREAGRQVGRVHVVDQPLSDYLRYELAVYAENAEAGEDIRIADRSVHPELEALTQDFVIFDRERRHPGLILFDHNASGRVTGYRVATDRRTVRACREQIEMALTRSVPVAEFMAAAAL